MLSDNEKNRIKKNKEKDKQSQEQKDKNQNRVNVETLREKENRETADRFVKKVIMLPVIILGIMIGAYCLLLVFKN